MPPGDRRSGAAWAGSNGTHVDGDGRKKVGLGGYYGSGHPEIVDPGASSEAVFSRTDPTSAILLRSTENQGLDPKAPTHPRKRGNSTICRRATVAGAILINVASSHDQEDAC